MIVIQKDLSGGVINIFEVLQLSEIEQLTGVNAGSISEVFLGKRRSAGGYLWSIYDYEVVSEAGEVWKVVKANSRQEHLISNFGRFKSRAVKTGFEFLRKLDHDRDGYAKIEFKVDGTRRVGRIVGMLFVEGYEPTLTIDHIDGVITNDNHTNLRWISLEENARTTKRVSGWEQYDKDLNLVGTFASAGEVQKYLGIDHNQHFKSRLSNGWYKGFRWVEVPLNRDLLKKEI